MKHLSEYQDKYYNAKLERDELGVLHVALHDGHGKTLRWSERAHTELTFLFRDISSDYDNRVVLLTGSDGKYMDFMEPGNFKFDPNPPSPGVDRLYREGKDLIFSLLDINVPVVAAMSGGPIYPHAELALLSDVVVAATDTVICDLHFVRGVVPGDGVHALWPILLGENRGRHYLLTGKEITAQNALDWGIVAEVVEPGQEIERAREIARQIADNHPILLRHTRELLTLEIRRRLRDALPLGVALEGLHNGYGNARPDRT